jgi:hypothetical protein
MDRAESETPETHERPDPWCANSIEPAFDFPVNESIIEFLGEKRVGDVPSLLMSVFVLATMLLYAESAVEDLLDLCAVSTVEDLPLDLYPVSVVEDLALDRSAACTAVTVLLPLVPPD